MSRHGKRGPRCACGLWKYRGDDCGRCVGKRRRCNKCQRRLSVAKFHRNGARGHAKTCKECLRIIEIARGRRGGRRRGKGDPLNRVLSSATKRGIAVTLTTEEYQELLKKPCHWCPDGELPRGGTGLDRLDNDRGYEPGNVVPACESCNTRRTTMAVEHWDAMMACLREHMSEAFWREWGKSRYRDKERRDMASARIAAAQALVELFSALKDLRGRSGDVSIELAYREAAAMRKRLGIPCSDMAGLYAHLRRLDESRSAIPSGGQAVLSLLLSMGRLSDAATVRDAASRYAEGATLAECGRMLGMSKAMAREMLLRLGVEVRSRGVRVIRSGNSPARNLAAQVAKGPEWRAAIKRRADLRARGIDPDAGSAA